MKMNEQFVFFAINFDSLFSSRKAQSHQFPMRRFF